METANLKHSRKKYVFIILCGVLIGAFGSAYVQTPASTLLVRSLYEHNEINRKYIAIEERVNQIERSIDELITEIDKIRG